MRRREFLLKYEPKTEPFEDTLGVWEMRQEYRKRIRFAAENKYGNLVRLVQCENALVENLMLQNSAAWTLELNGFDGVQAAMENITVENVIAEDAEIPVIITGTKDLTVRNVTLRNFDVRYAAGKDYYDYRPFVPAYDDTYPECNRMRNLNAYGLFARYADGVKLENFTVVPREDTKRDGIRLTEVENFESN